MPDERRMQPSRPTGPPAPPYVPRPGVGVAAEALRRTAPRASEAPGPGLARAGERSTALSEASYTPLFGSTVAPRSSSPSSPDFRRRTLTFAEETPGGWPTESPSPGAAAVDAGAERRHRTGPPAPLPWQSRVTGPPPAGGPVRGRTSTLESMGTLEADRGSDRSTARMLEDDDSSAVELAATELVSDPDVGRVFHALPPPPPLPRVTPVRSSAPPPQRASRFPGRAGSGWIPDPFPAFASGQRGPSTRPPSLASPLPFGTALATHIPAVDRSWETKDTVRPPPFGAHTTDAAAFRRPTEPPISGPAPTLRASLTPGSWAASFQPPPLRRAIVPIVVTHLVLAAAVLVGAAVYSRTRGAAVATRGPRSVTDERADLADPTPALALSPPPQGCAAGNDAHVVASRAQLGPGLDVAVLDSGFAVGLASTPKEAMGVRLGGVGLRVVERLRVKAQAPVNHVTLEPGHEEEGESLDVRADEGDVRTVVAGAQAGTFKVVARGAAITALLDDESANGLPVRSLWNVPGHAAPGGAKAAGGDFLRALGRDDGGALVALRRGSTLWLGVVDTTIAPAGPLLAITRRGATLGAPALATSGGGGVVVWAERGAGEHRWSIVAATFSTDGEGTSSLGALRVVAKGMSPAIAELPDGDLLLAHADGTTGSHRVVALRLGRDLSPRGEPIVVSPESINAGQPSIAVRADGRALVAFFSADRGRLPSVHAATLTCDPGL